MFSMSTTLPMGVARIFCLKRVRQSFMWPFLTTSIRSVVLRYSNNSVHIHSRYMVVPFLSSDNPFFYWLIIILLFDVLASDMVSSSFIVIFLNTFISVVSKICFVLFVSPHVSLA